ncbi:MAG TPA: LpxD N-terminal domain-containing protein, partial [Chthoniobacteraceae bacterium]
MPTAFTANEIARLVGGEVIGDGNIKLSGFANVENAREGDLVFAEKAEFLQSAELSSASAILVPLGFTSSVKVLVRVSHPRISVARLLPHFFPTALPPPGIDASAKIATSAQVDSTASVGPGCVIGEAVRIGPRCVLAGGNHVAQESQFGEDVHLYPNVVIYPRTIIGNRVTIHAGTTIGSDGYGYVFDEGRHRKVLQVGN